MECNERNTMSKLRIIELEQQLKRRDEYILKLESVRIKFDNHKSDVLQKLKSLVPYAPTGYADMTERSTGEFFLIQDVIEAFK